MPKYAVIHTHRFGTTVAAFESETEDLGRIFSRLPESPDDEDDEESKTQVEFARRLNLDYEPENEESLEIHELLFDEWDTVDFSDFE